MPEWEDHARGHGGFGEKEIVACRTGGGRSGLGGGGEGRPTETFIKDAYYFGPGGRAVTINSRLEQKGP